MTLLIAFFLLVLLVSFFCSLLEAMLLSVTPSHIAVMVQEKRPAGRLLGRLKQRIDQPLAAILTVNTVAHTLGSAGVGAQSLQLWGSKWVAVTSIVVTLAILIISEIIPKTLGAVHARRLAGFGAYAIQGLIVISYPLVILLEIISRAVAANTKAQGVTREEVLAFAMLGYKQGELKGKESRIIRNLFKLNEVKARDILTPRSVVTAFAEDQTIAQTVEQEGLARFTRYPLYSKDLDTVTGLAHRWDILQAAHEGRGGEPLSAVSRPARFVPDSKSVAELLDEFIKQKEHLFLVVDEYGGTAGIITLEDAIETLLGVEIMDETDLVADMREYARARWERKLKDNGKKK